MGIRKNMHGKEVIVFISRFCFIPWLVAHMITIIGLVIGALVIMVFFVFLFPLVNYALLAIIPLISAAGLLYW